MLWFMIILLLVIIGLFAYLLYIQTEIKDKNTSSTTTVDTLNGTLDSFGRERVSQSFTIGDYKHTYGTSFEFFTDITNGSVTYPLNKAEAQLELSGGTSGHVYYQTKKYHNYLPGKSQYILCSFVLGEAVQNVTKKIGYFDSENGIYLQQDDSGILSFVIRSNVTGAVEERVANQINWNGDMFDIDVTKTQLIFFDFQWLGVGKVRCGFINKNETYVSHVFYNSNVLDTVYISNPTLPIRAEIESNEILTDTVNMKQICSTVISEGGYSESGYDYSYVSDQEIEVLGTDIDKPILALKLRDNFNNYKSRGIIILDEVEVLATNNSINYKIVKVDNSGGVSGTFEDISSQSMAQINTGVSTHTFTDFIELDSSFVTADKHGSRIVGSPSNQQGSETKTNFIAQNMSSDNSQAYVILANSLGGTAGVYVALKWREIY